MTKKKNKKTPKKKKNVLNFILISEFGSLISEMGSIIGGQAFLYWAQAGLSLKLGNSFTGMTCYWGIVSGLVISCTAVTLKFGQILSAPLFDRPYTHLKLISIEISILI